MKRAIAEKRPEYATRHEAIIFHHDNTRPHVAIPVKNYLGNSGWEVLPHPLYSPDLAPSDYHLFQSMQNALTGIRFTSEQGIKNWLDSFLTAKPAQLFWDGIHKSEETERYRNTHEYERELMGMVEVRERKPACPSLRRPPIAFSSDSYGIVRYAFVESRTRSLTMLRQSVDKISSYSGQICTKNSELIVKIV